MSSFFNPEGKSVVVNESCLLKGKLFDSFNYLEGEYEFKPVKAYVLLNSVKVVLGIDEGKFRGDIFVDCNGKWDINSYGNIWRYENEWKTLQEHILKELCEVTLVDFETEVCQLTLKLMTQIFAKRDFTDMEIEKIKELSVELEK